MIREPLNITLEEIEFDGLEELRLQAEERIKEIFGELNDEE